jgi:diguanylate cyclase (GGDEF)-like protein/PAS domain S-box-containing protein
LDDRPDSQLGDLPPGQVIDALGIGVLVIAVGSHSVRHNARFRDYLDLPPELAGSGDATAVMDHVRTQVSSPRAFVDGFDALVARPDSGALQTLRCRNGRVLELQTSPVTENGAMVASVWSFLEVSHCDAIKRDLKREVGFRNAIVRTLPDLVWLKDPDGVYLACNGRFEAFFGSAEGDILGKTDYDFIDRELADMFRENDVKAIRNNAPTTNEEWITFANDGHREFLETTKTPMFDQDGQLIGVLGIGHDISRRRESQQRIRDSEQRFALAMRGANDGLWDWNLETDEVYYSPRWTRMLGYAEDELHGGFETLKNLICADDRAGFIDAVDAYLAGRSDSFEIEMCMRHKNGSDVIVLSRAFRVLDEFSGKAIRLVGTHVDITERKRAEAFDERNAEILEMIASGRPAPLIYDEIALMYEARHPGMRCSMLELEDGKLMHGGAPSLPKAYCDAVHGLQNGPNVGSCGTSTYTGKRVLVEDIATDPKWAKIRDAALEHGLRSCWSEPIKDSSGKVLGAFGMYYNMPSLPNEEESNDLRSAARLAGIVMEREQNQRRIRQLAFSDELTGLESRASFYQHMDLLIKSAKRSGDGFGLLYLDLDDFKDVNDSLGHDAGDALLRDVAMRLRHVSRESDFVARLGGDEFCIVVQDRDDEDTVGLVAMRCLEALRDPVKLSARKVTLGCSIGIANYPDDGSDVASLLKAADTSLYAAKEDGKNRFAFYRPEFTAKAERRFRVEHDLRDAIEQHQLSLVYQPQVSAGSGRIVGVEALARWHHATLGDVSPTDFIPMAERIGLIGPLTEWVLMQACRQAVAWREAGFDGLRMAVNISPILFRDQDLVTLVGRVIEDTGMVSTDLELEVTESVVQTDPGNVAILEALKDLGCQLAIDDFGVGYSSFKSLNHLTVDCLKIDRYFINDMLHDEQSHMLVQSMIEIGHRLGHEIVAEGVETQAQSDLLETLGCETMQGFLFSRPMSADDATAVLAGARESGVDDPQSFSDRA